MKFNHDAPSITESLGIDAEGYKKILSKLAELSLEAKTPSRIFEGIIESDFATEEIALMLFEFGKQHQLAVLLQGKTNVH